MIVGPNQVQQANQQFRFGVDPFDNMATSSSGTPLPFRPNPKTGGALHVAASVWGWKLKPVEFFYVVNSWISRFLVSIGWLSWVILSYAWCREGAWLKVTTHDLDFRLLGFSFSFQNNRFFEISVQFCGFFFKTEPINFTIFFILLFRCFGDKITA